MTVTEPTAGPADDAAPGARLLELVQVMDALRARCPWDARQTHESLTPYLLEETYEAVDALTAGDQAAVREELGDVLLQVVFHARVAQERTDGTGYTIDDIADAITDKLKRRHPHVFGDVSVSGPDEVKRNWDAIKAAERAAASGGGPGSVLDGVPLGQPALSLATQLLRRAERAGAPAELAAEHRPTSASSAVSYSPWRTALGPLARILSLSCALPRWRTPTGSARGRPGRPGKSPQARALRPNRRAQLAGRQALY